MLRQVVNQTRGQKAVDGAGVHLVRVLGIRNTSLYDPFLMLDAFDSTDSKEFEAGFPNRDSLVHQQGPDAPS